MGIPHKQKQKVSIRRSYSVAIKIAFVGFGDTLRINSTLAATDVMEQ